MVKLEKIRRNDYFILPFDDYRASYYVMKKGSEKEILKELIREATIQAGKEFNKLDKGIIEIVMEHFHFHIYQDLDTNKHANTRVHLVNGERILVNKDEEEYFEQIELVVRDFHAKVEYGSVLIDIINDLKLVIPNKTQEMTYLIFAHKYFSTENISLEIIHEKFETSGFDNCANVLADICNEITSHAFVTARIRLIGNQLRPFGVVYHDQSRNKEGFAMSCASQEENKLGLYVAVRNERDYLFTFELDEENKINKISIIRGGMIPIYNFINDESEPLM